MRDERSHSLCHCLLVAAMHESVCERCASATRCSRNSIDALVGTTHRVRCYCRPHHHCCCLSAMAANSCLCCCCWRCCVPHSVCLLHLNRMVGLARTASSRLVSCVCRQTAIFENTSFECGQHTCLRQHRAEQKNQPTLPYPSPHPLHNEADIVLKAFNVNMCTHIHTYRHIH